MQTKIVETFALTIADAARQYTRIPDNSSGIFHHYTTHEGLEGILRCGGLRATYRMKMSDTGEFVYAKRIILQALVDIQRCKDFSSVAKSLVKYTRINLKNLLANSPEYSSSYCACLTVEPDHSNQWKKYAEGGRGFAIGFDLQELLNEQVANVKKGFPFIFCAPVTYDKVRQNNLVWDLMKAGISDMQRFSSTISNKATDLTALRDRITKEIVANLLVLINFFKHQNYRSEREIRLMLDSNDGTLLTKDIKYFPCESKSIPHIFLDLRDPSNNLLPLKEIKIGPKASFLMEKNFLDDLLKEFGYDRNIISMPGITRSKIASD